MALAQFWVAEGRQAQVSKQDIAPSMISVFTRWFKREFLDVKYFARYARCRGIGFCGGTTGGHDAGSNGCGCDPV